MSRKDASTKSDPLLHSLLPNSQHGDPPSRDVSPQHAPDYPIHLASIFANQLPPSATTPRPQEMTVPQSACPATQYSDIPPQYSHLSQPTSGPASSQHTLETTDEASLLEDRRQRNTAASARFRLKKKQRAIELERTVSDLNSRAAELEKEATDLRRENTWLKEIVILKGRQNFAGGAHKTGNIVNTAQVRSESAVEEAGSLSEESHHSRGEGGSSKNLPENRKGKRRGAKRK